MMLDIAVFPMFAGLLPDGSILLELAIGDDEHLAKVTMPSTGDSRLLTSDELVTIDLDVLPYVAPMLAREIETFVGEIRAGLIARAVQG